MPENYEGQWWGYIYDQMMENLLDWVENNRRFYLANLKSVKGPVLECACGTGIFLLPLLQSGFDIFGFDISPSMLATLQKKAAAQGIEDISNRISIQNFETFHYEHHFEAILIPTNSFGMLATQDAQIRVLRNIHKHLAPGGKLLLDLRLAGIRDLAEMPETVEAIGIPGSTPRRAYRSGSGSLGVVISTGSWFSTGVLLSMKGRVRTFR